MSARRSGLREIPRRIENCAKTSNHGFSDRSLPRLCVNSGRFVSSGLHRRPHGRVARAPDFRGGPRRARRTRRGRNRGWQTVHRPHPALRSRGGARSCAATERNAATGADHRGSRRRRCVDRIRRTVRTTAHWQSRADRSALLAAALADGTNLGLARLADASRGLGYHHLVNVAQWHISDDNYVAARAAIINIHHRHPMAAIWDDGTTSSSDGQYFRAGGRAGAGGSINAKYGIDPNSIISRRSPSALPAGSSNPPHTIRWKIPRDITVGRDGGIVR
jgi:Tn3 transposase DDE domain